MMLRLEILAIVVALIALALGVGEWHGHHRGWDGGVAHEQTTIAAAQLQATQDLAAHQARVVAADQNTLKIDYQFTADHARLKAVQVVNVQEQQHAIAKTPSLVQCALPAAVVRLRQQQAAASAAIAAGQAQASGG